MIHENGLLACLREGGSALCLPIRISRSPHIAYMARAAGFEALYVDMEQSDVSHEAVGSLCQTAWAAGVTPLVRVPMLDDYLVARALDGGAGGVIVPHVETVDMARRAVSAARFAPRGNRSGAGAGLAQGYARSSGEPAEAKLDEQTMVIVMLESRAAVDAAEAIAAIDGVDLLFVGAGDLGRDLGVHGQVSHPEIRKAFQKVGEACARHGKTLGVGGVKGASAAQTLADLHGLGARFLSTMTDEALLMKAAHDEAATLRRIFSS
jgi:2-keto-3-deoxy-L-rhamnonate aldolase RhmA